MPTHEAADSWTETILGAFAVIPGICEAKRQWSNTKGRPGMLVRMRVRCSLSLTDAGGAITAEHIAGVARGAAGWAAWAGKVGAANVGAKARCGTEIEQRTPRINCEKRL